MGLRFLRVCIALCCGLAAGLASATQYTIETTTDIVAADGDCSLREAVQAIATQSAVNECEEGTQSNRILLQPGETYLLNGGAMALGDGSTFMSVTIDVERPNAFDKAIRDNAVIVASANNRVFEATGSTLLVVRNITLQGNGTVTGNGGLVLSDGRVVADLNAIFENGSVSGSGGAIYLSGADTSLSLQLTRFTGNSADVNGGAIATDAAFTGEVDLSTSYFDGNEALVAGGVMYLDGANPPNRAGLLVQMSNSTFYDNTAADGGALYFAGLDRITFVNNLTVAGNDSGTNAAVAYGAHDPDPAEDRDVLLNSVIVGNVGVDCSFLEDFAYLAYVVSDGCGAAAGGLDEERPLYNSDSAEFDVLLGADGNPCTVGSGPLACTPSTDFARGFAGFLPNSLATGPAAFAAGSPEGSVANACVTQDQRNVDRADRCDAGAVEYQISRAITDEFMVIQGRLAPLDVLENDKGDNTIDCRLANGAITVPVVNEPIGTAPVSDCVTLSIPPNRGDVFVNIDANGYPTLAYRSEDGFHGLDVLRYSIARAAVDGATFADGPLSAQTNLVVEPATGFTESETIDDLAGAAMWQFLLVTLLAGLRRLRRAVLVLLVALPAPAMAADIRVTTLLDAVAYDDGLCSIREALGNSIDNTPIFSPDCSFGATGRDTILLPAGTLTLDSPLLIENTVVDLQGEGIADTIITGSGGSRLITASSSTTLRYLTLEGGVTTDRGGAINTTSTLVLEQVLVRNNSASDDGGAIFLNFNSDETRDVVFNAVQFEGNQSTGGNGGAVGMFGQFQEHDIAISDTTFVGNTAAGVGGALDVNLQRGGSLNVANSTFSANDAGAGGSAVDLQDSVAPVAFMNITINDHASGTATGAIDMGNSSAIIRMSNSVYSNAGACSSGTARFSNTSRNNVFSTPRDLSCIADSEPAPPDPDANNEAAPADIDAVMGSDLVASTGNTDDYVPQHYAIDPTQAGNPAYAFIVDAGSTGDLRAGFTGPANCRLEDLRGEPRSAGSGCDLGSYELQVATAVPDAGRNQPRLDRNAIIDVLDNDLPGEGGTILTGTIELLSQPALGTASVVLRDDETAPCTNPTDDCVVFYESPPLTCADFDPDPFEETFTYRFQYTALSGGGFSVSGAEDPSDDLITVTISNVPPQLRGATRYTERGVPVVFPLQAEDPDGATAPTNYTISREPQFAKTRIIDLPEPDDDIVTAEGVGVVINETAGTITYYPADITKAFNDSFTIELEDECGRTSTGRFFVRYLTEDTSGSELLSSGGSLPPSMLLLSVLLFMRRR